jgi:hypothetical protein
MLINVSEQVSVEQNTGTVRNGNINEGIQCYQNTAILNLHYNSKYRTVVAHRENSILFYSILYISCMLLAL